MSTNWWRNKKRQKRFNLFKALGKNRDEEIPRALRIRRYPHSYAYRTQRRMREKKLSAPEPLIDVFEEKDEVVVVAEFAGFGNEDMRINVKNQRLTLSAETSDQKFYKSLNLPTRVISNPISTRYKNGVLEIRFRKRVTSKKEYASRVENAS